MSAIQNERLVLEQESGDPVTLVANGDEFYARMETPDGYTVVYDVGLGLYCYAVVVDGCFKSTEIPVHKRPPVGTRKHLQESSAVRAAKFEDRFRVLNQQERVVPGAGGINYTLGQNNGLLAGRRVSDFTDSAGLGRYCLMSSGNHLNYGRTPAPVCGYLRDLVDWPSNSVYLSDPAKHKVAHGDYGTVFKYLTDKPNEYFVVENRSKMNLDEYLPSSGLAVFHCDTEGSNEWQAATPDRHYQCALLQADGRRDLENDRRGDADDMFADVDGVRHKDRAKCTRRNEHPSGPVGSTAWIQSERNL